MLAETEMPLYGSLLMSVLGLISVIALAFAGWCAKRIGDLAQQISASNATTATVVQAVARLEERVSHREQDCATRLHWLRQMDLKLDKLKEDAAVTRNTVVFLKDTFEKGAQ